MIGWLWRVIFGQFTLDHQHLWEIIKTINVYDGGGPPFETKLVLQCAHCGNIKKKTI